MNTMVVEWISKADGDFATAGREIRARKNPNLDAACFHIHEMVEKYLKAILHANQQHTPKTHDLLNLLELCLPFESTLILLKDIIAQLDRYSMQYQYPGKSADRAEARMAFKFAGQFRDFVRNLATLNL